MTKDLAVRHLLGLYQKAQDDLAKANASVTQAGADLVAAIKKAQEGSDGEPLYAMTHCQITFSPRHWSLTVNKYDRLEVTELYDPEDEK